MREGPPKQFKHETSEDVIPTMLYAEQHKQEAAQYNKKWRVWLKLREEKTPEDIAYEKALLENEGFNLRESVEYKQWEIANERVFVELREKRDQPAAETEHIRPLIYFGGGAMLGVFGAAQAKLLQELGLDKSFTTIVGNSAGSGTAAYFAAGDTQPDILASMYTEECTTDQFLGWKSDQPLKYMDASVIANAMRSPEKKLDEAAILRSTTSLYVLATNSQTGKSEFLDMKRSEPDGSDMVTKIEASAAITLFQKPVMINGIPYVDGAYAHTSVEEMIRQFNPTSILIIPNEGFKPRMDMIKGGILSNVSQLLHSAGANIRQKVFGSSAFGSEIERYLEMQQRGREFIDELYHATGVKLGVLWAPPSTLGPLSNNVTDVKVALMDAYTDAAKQLGEEVPRMAF